MTGLRARGATLGSVLSGATAKAGSWAMLGQLVSAVAAAASFITLARIFGPAVYGPISAALALVLTTGLLAGFGASSLVARDIAGGRLPPATALSAAVAVVWTAAAPAGLALLLLQPLLLPQVPVALVMTLAAAELLANAVTTCCVATFFAVGRARAAGVITAVAGAAKLLSVGVFAVVGGGDPQAWANLYAASTAATTVVAVSAAFRRYGRPVVRGHRVFARAREGLPFSVNLATSAVQNDADKVVLVRFGFAYEAGIYTAAYRLLGMALMPIMAFLQVTYPRFFAVGHEGGLAGTAAYSRRLLKPLAAYAAVTGLLLALLAPLAPALLGPEYEDVVPVIVVLAPLLLLKVAQYMPGGALTGAGLQGVRATCTTLSAAANVLLCLLLIPRHGLTGAIVATLAAEVLLVALLMIALRRRLRRSVAPAASQVRLPSAPGRGEGLAARPAGGRRRPSASGSRPGRPGRRR